MRANIVTALGALALVFVAAGCTASKEQLITTATDRAAFDLDCPAADIRVTQLGDTVIIGRSTETAGLERTVFGVSGCGRKVVYVVECVTNAVSSRCNAVLNADERPAPSSD